MCDTWVALSDVTLSRNVILGKNSDRPIFDCQPLVFSPRKEWPAHSHLQTEYVELPQVEVTYAHLGSSPYWCWGYEEGINEYGVVIGNEAIFTKTFREAAGTWGERGQPEPGLLGMDLIRLALERSQTARHAVDVMGKLIEQYGQFGSGVPTKSHSAGGYDNSFLIADPREAWVLEAVGTRWAAQCFSQGYASISNQPSLRNQWDCASRDVRAFAVERGWWPADDQASFDFGRAYIDERVPRQVSHIRAARSQQLLAEKAGQITPGWMRRIARDHYEGTFLQGPYFDAADPDFLTLCMHVSPADFTWGNTASSCVAVLPKSSAELPVFWWTPGPPCNGCYVPFFVHGGRLPEMVSRAGTGQSAGKQVVAPPEAQPDTFSPDSYWWLFRRLMDHVKGDPVNSLPGHYPRRNSRVRAAFDPLEREFEAEVPDVMRKAVKIRETDPDAAAHVLDEFSERCVNKVVAAVHALPKDLN
jgi:secernin